jgi:hypothetical protein
MVVCECAEQDIGCSQREQRFNPLLARHGPLPLLPNAKTSCASEMHPARAVPQALDVQHSNITLERSRAYHYRLR